MVEVVLVELAQAICIIPSTSALRPPAFPSLGVGCNCCPIDAVAAAISIPIATSDIQEEVVVVEVGEGEERVEAEYLVEATPSEEPLQKTWWSRMVAESSLLTRHARSC